MSVVDGKVIFCEGKKEGLDSQLLKKILSDLSIQNLTIVAAGSKFTFSIFAQGYFYSGNIEKSPDFMVFRDRDFDAVPSERMELCLRDKMFLSHRACIENYLIDPNLIHSYWEKRYQDRIEYPTTKWGHGNSPGIEKISAWIEQSAIELKEYQSVRWALGDLLLTGAARKNLETTWTEGSGHLPTQLEFQYCQNKAIELIDQFRFITDKITEESFRASLAKYQSLFNQPEFWEKKQYMIWFHGKDLQKTMQKRENRYISLQDFFVWAVNHININQYPDLIQLQQEIMRISSRLQ